MLRRRGRGESSAPKRFFHARLIHSAVATIPMMLKTAMTRRSTAPAPAAAGCELMFTRRVTWPSSPALGVPSLAVVVVRSTSPRSTSIDCDSTSASSEWMVPRAASRLRPGNEKVSEMSPRCSSVSSATRTPPHDGARCSRSWRSWAAWLASSAAMSTVASACWTRSEHPPRTSATSTPRARAATPRRIDGAMEVASGAIRPA